MPIYVVSHGHWDNVLLIMSSWVTWVASTCIYQIPMSF